MGTNGCQLLATSTVFRVTNPFSLRDLGPNFRTWICHDHTVTPQRKLDMNHSVKQLSLLLLGVLALITGLWVSGIFEKKTVVMAEETLQLKPSHELKADILWVIDNSGTMWDEQLSLATNLDRFVHNFVERPENQMIDFKIAVTTTDPMQNGQFVKGRILTRDDAIRDKAAFIHDFKEIVTVGIDGSPFETHFAPLQACLRNNYQSFFRKDAVTVINVLSDEPDNTLPFIGFEAKVRQILDELRSYKPTGDSLHYQKLMFNAIIGPNCVQQRYAAHVTGGIIGDLQAHFGNSLAAISDRIQEVIHSYRLSKKVTNPSGIEIWDENDDPVTAFTFDPELNAVQFSKAPGTASTYTIVYEFDNLYDETLY